MDVSKSVPLSVAAERAIVIKSPEELAVMRRAGQIVAAILARLVKEVRPGLVTAELETITQEELKRQGALSSFKGYRGYPASLCVSINDEIVHGIPGPRVLKEGDIVALDMGTIVDGFQGDGATTVGVGKIGPRARRLIEVTQGALDAGIAAARGGAWLGDISAAIQEYVESRGFSIVREYVGHGIGRQMHEEPQVPNFGERGTGPRLRKGMALALEPMVNAGGWRTRVKEDRWTVVTADGSLSAHFEHTIAITDGEAEILTRL
ncbi:MAG: type I methionyl aminopeptidase [Chloroflexi bacterium]|nr:type I methionyl aminopeptidase [Chloroflexota bacterium]